MSEICCICGCSVAPGSGRFVNRIPELNDPETRAEMGRSYPSGDYICEVCENDQEKTKMADTLSGRMLPLGYDPKAVIYAVTWNDVTTVLTDMLFDEGVSPDDLTSEELEDLLQAGLHGAEDLPCYETIETMLETAWPEERFSELLFRVVPNTESDEGPLVEQAENAARLGDDSLLESIYEDRVSGFGDY